MKNNEAAKRFSVVLGEAEHDWAFKQAFSLKIGRFDVLYDQVAASIIVGSIAGVSAYTYAGEDV
jgi:hypothetical protein